MKIMYFAWIRERIGYANEEIALPPGVKTVGAFLTWMKTRGDEFAYALENDTLVRVALNQEHCNDLSHSLENVSEIALFPPMTGG